MNIRTDLALEHSEQLSNIDGISYSEEMLNNIKLTKIEITDNISEIKELKKGSVYYTVDIGKPWIDDFISFKNKTLAFSEVIRRFVKPKAEGSLLVVGLGNRTITADAIGPYTVNKVIVTRHIKGQDMSLFKNLGLYDIAAISPGVLGQTGIESADIIKSVSASIRPSAVIAVDALAGRKLQRLATTIQISNCGISPGSGVGNQRHEISETTLGVPVITIGVPTIVDAATLAYDVSSAFIRDERIKLDKIRELLNDNDLNYFVTPKETDKIMDSISSVIAYSINLAFNEVLTFEEMLALTE